MLGFYLIIGLVWLCAAILVAIAVVWQIDLHKRAWLGDELLAAVDGDWRSARLACKNVREETEIMRRAIGRGLLGSYDVRVP